MINLPQDLKEWYAISCPVKGLRFDQRTLALLDTNGDGHIQTGEVLAAVELLNSKGVQFEASEEKLAEIVKRRDDLEKLEPPSPEELQLVEGAQSLAAVEEVVDRFFITDDSNDLITEEAAKELPLKGNVNLKYVGAFSAFCAKCVERVYPGKEKLTYEEWQELKAKFNPYRGGVAKPAADSEKAKAADEERICRYKLHLDEFIRNYVTMAELYGDGMKAMFQTGVLRIAGREINLCFHVEDEAAHSALSGKSKCFLMYVKLTQPEVGAERRICAVVTAGTVAGLYVGRNGLFYDRDGGIWEAVVTKVIENQISLVEAFWAPWKKIGDSISALTKKFLAGKQTAATEKMLANTQNLASGQSAQSNGAAMASSVAAIGIGVGLVGAAFASLMAAISRMTPLQLAGSVLAVVIIVSLPSMILTWFNLRRRDLGAILNASGWAINREMRFSIVKAAAFTKCAKTGSYRLLLGALAVIAIVASLIYLFIAVAPIG